MTKRAKESFSAEELAVLSFLRERYETEGEIPKEVADIARGSDLDDGEEVLRALYTLEGKRLVQPEPEGDFTSRHWKITPVGVRALELLRAA